MAGRERFLFIGGLDDQVRRADILFPGRTLEKGDALIAQAGLAQRGLFGGAVHGDSRPVKGQGVLEPTEPVPAAADQQQAFARGHPGQGESAVTMRGHTLFTVPRRPRGVEIRHPQMA